jgi:uncharacterized protein
MALGNSRTGVCVQYREMPVRRSRSVLPWLLLSLVFAFTAPLLRSERVEDLPKPTDYISDYANVLSPEAKARLDRLCGQLDHSKTNAQIAVVTIKTLDGEDAATFANHLEDKWGVGKKGSDRGILMLFAIQDHKRWIEVGLGLQGILPDAKVGDIGRAMVPALRQRNYDGAVTTGVVQIANVIAADAGVSLQSAQRGDSDEEAQPVRRQQRRGGSLIGLVFKVGIVLLILIFFGARGLFGFGLGMMMGGGGRGWGGGGYGGGGGGSSGGGSGFGGFGGGSSDGGGAGGDW